MGKSNGASKVRDIDVVMALCMMKHLYNKGEISEIVYKNIKKEYLTKLKDVAYQGKI